MIGHCCNWCLKVIGVVLLMVCISGNAFADWLTIKNDTNKTIVVQETVVVNGQVKHGKPTNLLPGEKLHEFLSGPTKKQINVFEFTESEQGCLVGFPELQGGDSELFSVTIRMGKSWLGKWLAPNGKRSGNSG